jgi:hypothetical protein
VSESYATRSSSIELPNDFTAVQRLKLQSYILQKVVNVHTAFAEDFGARGKILTVSPPVHAQQLVTALYAFRQDERDGNLKQA